ncbi:MAG: histidine triad nucleotide-binding protein [Actinomycetota bacterium]
MNDVVDSACVFCRIVSGDIPATIVHAGERVVAFRDLNPAAPTHVLVVPREHVARMSDLEDRHGDALADLFQVASHVARAEGIDRTGWRLVVNEGADAGQSVFHLHAHVLGGRSLAWPPG